MDMAQQDKCLNFEGREADQAADFGAATLRFSLLRFFCFSMFFFQGQVVEIGTANEAA